MADELLTLEPEPVDERYVWGVAYATADSEYVHLLMLGSEESARMWKPTPNQNPDYRITHRRLIRIPLRHCDLRRIEE